MRSRWCATGPAPEPLAPLPQAMPGWVRPFSAVARCADVTFAPAAATWTFEYRLGAGGCRRDPVPERIPDPRLVEAAATKRAEDGGVVAEAIGPQGVLDARHDVRGGAGRRHRHGTTGRAPLRLASGARLALRGVGPVAAGAAVGRQRADAGVHRCDVGSTVREGRNCGKEQPEASRCDEQHQPSHCPHLLSHSMRGIDWGRRCRRRTLGSVSPPLLDVPSVAPHLHAIVAGVGHVDAASSVDRDAVGDTGTFRSPTPGRRRSRGSRGASRLASRLRRRRRPGPWHRRRTPGHSRRWRSRAAVQGCPRRRPGRRGR